MTYRENSSGPALEVWYVVRTCLVGVPHSEALRAQGRRSSSLGPVRVARPWNCIKVTCMNAYRNTQRKIHLPPKLSTEHFKRDAWPDLRGVCAMPAAVEDRAPCGLPDRRKPWNPEPKPSAPSSQDLA